MRSVLTSRSIVHGGSMNRMDNWSFPSYRQKQVKESL
jgi:hypothetical protein